MSRPLIPLALIFALVIAAAGGLLYWSERGEQPNVAQAPAEAPRAAADLGAPTGNSPPDAGDSASQAAAGRDRPDGPPADAPAGEAIAPAGPPGDTAAAPAASEGAPGEAAPDGAPAASSAPTFDIVRVEPTGEALLAGRAEAGASVEILSGGEVIARATADAEGAFLAIPEAALPPGSHDLSVRVAGSSEPARPEQRVAVIVPGADPDGAAEGGERVARAPDPAASGEVPVGAPAPGQVPGAEEQSAAVGEIGGAPETIQPGGPVADAPAGGAGEPVTPADETPPAASGDVAAADRGAAAPEELPPPGAQPGSGSVISSPAEPGAPPPDMVAGPPPGAPGLGADLAGTAPEAAQGAELSPGAAAGGSIGAAPADRAGAGTQAPGDVDVVIGPPNTPPGTPDAAASEIAPPDVATAPAAPPEPGEQDIAALRQPGSGAAGDAATVDTAPATAGPATDKATSADSPVAGGGAAASAPGSPAAAGEAPGTMGPGIANAPPAGPSTPDGRIGGPSPVDPGAARTAVPEAVIPEGLPEMQYAPLPPNFGKAPPAAGTDVAAVPSVAVPDGEAVAGAADNASTDAPAAATAGADRAGAGAEQAAGPGDPETPPGATADAADAIGNPPPFPGALAAAPGASQTLPDVRYAPQLPNFGTAGPTPGAAAAVGSPGASGDIAAGEQDVAALPSPGTDAGAAANPSNEGEPPPLPGAGTLATPGPSAGSADGLTDGTGATQPADSDLAVAGQARGEDTAEITLRASATAVPSAGAGETQAGAPVADGAVAVAAAGPLPAPVAIGGAASAAHDSARSPHGAGAVAAAGPLPLPAAMDGAAGALGVAATAGGQNAGAAAAAGPLPGSAPASAAAGSLPLNLSIKAAEAEADKLYVAGAAAPGALVRIYADEELVGEARANDKGAWLVEARKDVPLGQVTIRADVVDAAPQSPAARIELPFTRYADGLVLEPVVTASADGAGASASGEVPQPAFVIIRRGDNLWRISKRNYGRGIRYHSIFGANRDQIRNPDRIYPGQVFVVPTRDRRWGAAAN